MIMNNIFKRPKKIPKITYMNKRYCYKDFELDLCLFPKSFRFKVGLGDYESGIDFALSLWFFSIYAAYSNHKLNTFFQNKLKRKTERYGNGRVIGFSIYDWSIHFSLWEDPMAWSSDDPRWWSFTFNIPDFFLGTSKHSSELLEARNVEIPMPEKPYKSNIELSLVTWKRSRWFKKQIKTIKIEIEEGIPFEGKGTSSYNCGLDRTYSFHSQANSIPEGVGKLVGSALGTRVKYGGWKDWNFNIINMDEALR